MAKRRLNNTPKPRQPLTAKRKSAIESYVRIRSANKSVFLSVLVDWTLKAERMNANDLYDWLAKRGYKYYNIGGNGSWSK